MKHRALALATLALLCIASSRAEPELSTDWKAQARSAGLDETAIAQLEKNRILITDNTCRQIFTAYLFAGENPLFITSDSLLNAYHVLYEETIARIENTNATRLREFMQTVGGNLDGAGSRITGNPELVGAAKKRAKLVAGIALRLMDDAFRYGDAELDTILKDECDRIVAGKGQHMPKWLGTPTSSFMGINYNRYKPRGFYTRSAHLSRYFRALSWLQSIPFRIDNTEEFLAILLLGDACPSPYDTDLIDLGLFLGAPDNLDIFAVSESSSFIDLASDNLGELQKEYTASAKKHATGQINDTVPSFRIISAHQTPGAMLFNKTTNNGPFKRLLPSGLEVAAALGSDHARTLLPATDRDALLAVIKEAAPTFSGSPFPVWARRNFDGTLYQTYLHVLQALVDPPDPDAPDFMKQATWKTKSLNTLLGSWAQMRHTWALQAKQSIAWRCPRGNPPNGLVEPYPEFFSRMANLAYATKTILEKTDALEPEYTQAVGDIRAFVAFAREFQTRDEFEDKFHKLSSDDQPPLFFGYNVLETANYRRKIKGFKEQLEWMETAANDIEAGKLEEYPRLKRLLDHMNNKIMVNWNNLERISKQLETIAHKQLRGMDLNEADVRFIGEYGKILASLMFYDGHAADTPLDDAPKIVDVYSNLETGQHLHVGIARPQIMYVLYPWQGETLLCMGAVMPYREFAHATRLNDAEWKAMLDSPQRPDPPDWLAPIQK